MYFDVPNNDMNNLHVYDIQNEAEWGAFTRNCIGGKWKVAFADRNDVGLVTGKLVQNAGLVSRDDEVEPVRTRMGACSLPSENRLETCSWWTSQRWVLLYLISTPRGGTLMPLASIHLCHPDGRPSACCGGTEQGQATCTQEKIHR